MIGAFMSQALLDIVSFLLMPAKGSQGVPVRLTVSLWNKRNELLHKLIVIIVSDGWRSIGKDVSVPGHSDIKLLTAFLFLSFYWFYILLM